MTKQTTLSETMSYGLALVSDDKHDRVRGPTLVALERRGLVSRPRGDLTWRITEAGAAYLGVEFYDHSALATEPTEPTPTEPTTTEPIAITFDGAGEYWMEGAGGVGGLDLGEVTTADELRAAVAECIDAGTGDESWHGWTTSRVATVDSVRV